MDETTAGGSATEPVEWHHCSPEAVSSPIARQLPYFECKLEHPTLEPTGRNNRFFPDTVPYELAGTQRVFYWRSAVAPTASDPNDWELACGTPHELLGYDSLPADGPPLVTDGASGTTLVVDGTIGGDVTTCHVASYTAPEIAVASHSSTAIGITVNGTEHAVSNGSRRRIELPEQRVEPTDDDGDSVTVRPELVVRYPGQRQLHHPAPGATYRLFPSFGLDLEAVPNPLPVPTTAGELDDGELATELGVDLAERPYPERVLWQAFGYTAFDPHAAATPELTQLSTGHIVVRTAEAQGD